MTKVLSNTDKYLQLILSIKASELDQEAYRKGFSRHNLPKKMKYTNSQSILSISLEIIKNSWQKTSLYWIHNMDTNDKI